ncbi:MAG: alpha-L-arabinofuranosidase C-terminal domain-containing protein [Bryobacteraceae bacterium]|jgi:alpha-N-arabinofuranosidase
MTSVFTRRQFARAGATAGLTALLPRGLFSAPTTNRHALIRAEDEIGLVRPEFHSHFAEHLGSCVYGGIWVGPKSPIENVEGYRKAAVDYLKELGVPALRWPGGCYADDYHWREGIGPAARRPKRVNIHWGNYVEDNSFGTHEFIRFCRLISAEPYFAANVGSGSPREMRDWIEYCNFPSGSALADERAANGSPEPFRVKYWGVGNELWGCGGNFRPDGAGAEFRRFASYARTFGDIKPYLIGCGPGGNDSRWTRGFMDAVAGSRLPDGYSLHYYENGADPPLDFTPAAAMEQLLVFGRMEQAIIEQRALLDGYERGRGIGLFLDEWGVWDRIPKKDQDRYGALWQQSTMRSAVAAGLGLNIFNRQADKLYMCNIAQMVNVLQSVLLTDGPEGKNCVRTTTYYAFMLFKPHRGKTAVPVDGGSGIPMGHAFSGPPEYLIEHEYQPPMPELSISASRSASELVVSLVNPRAGKDFEVECALRGVKAKRGRAQILHAFDLNACNSFDHPDRVTIQPQEVAVEPDRMRIMLPAMSVATVTLDVE